MRNRATNFALLAAGAVVTLTVLLPPIDGLVAAASSSPPSTCQVDVSPSSVAPGDQVDVSSSAGCFAPNDTITITLDGTTTLGTVTTDANGNFATTVTIPSGTSSGQHTIDAADTQGNTGSAPMTVSTAPAPTTTTTTTAPPGGLTTSLGQATSPTPCPAGFPAGTVCAFPGDPLHITGNGFSGPSSGDGTFYSTPVSLGAIPIDGNGAYSANTAVPATADPGQHSIVVVGPGPGATTHETITPITVLGASTAPGATPAASGATPASGGGAGGAATPSGALAATGHDMTRWIIRALALLVGGLLMLFGARGYRTQMR